MEQQIQDQINKHFQSAPVFKYKKGEILIHAGEDPAGVYQLIDGIVEQYDITPEGNMVTVNIFKPPAFFPMSWAINKTPNTYFFTALTELTVKVAGADSTVNFIKSNPTVLFDLLSRVYKGTDALLQRHVILARGIASSKLIFELLIEAYRFGSQLDSGFTSIKLKQTTLAARSGLARETVSRELHKLENQKYIILDKDAIQVDTALLEQKLNSII